MSSTPLRSMTMTCARKRPVRVSTSHSCAASTCAQICIASSNMYTTSCAPIQETKMRVGLDRQ